MHIRIATHEDLPFMLSLLEQAKSRLANLAIDQWQDGYPNETSIRQDIDCQEAYVGLIDDRIVLTMAFSTAGDPNYDRIEEGSWISPERPYGVLHRMSVHEDWLEKGLARQAFMWAEKELLVRGFYAMRVDTHPGNLPMQKLLRNMGYVYTGHIYVRGNGLREAFEKTLCLGETPPLYHTFLLDADDTLLDFQASQDEAFRYTCHHFGVEPTEDLIRTYARLNSRYWAMFERGEITKEALVVARFDELVAQHGLPGTGIQWEAIYQPQLAQGFHTVSHAHEVLQQLHQQATLACVTNGVASTQQNRLTHAGLAPYFDALFISEAVGAPKPEAFYFQHVQQALSLPHWQGVLLVGDSPTSDMAGGFRMGIDTCWVHTPETSWQGQPQPTYQITDLRQLLTFSQPMRRR